MADELDPVVQQFEADVAEYVANVEEASASAEEFAVSAEEAKASADGLRDSLLEAAAAAGIYQDAAGKWRDSSGRFASSAEMDALGLGRLRDDAIEAAASVKELGDQADETAAKLDLMGLSGASTFTSLGPLLGIIGAIVIAAAAVAPAVAAMGLGFAAAGVFAIPTIMQITGGLTTIATDTAAVNNATTATAKNTALAKLHKDWAAIPAPIQDVITSIQGLEATWKQTAAFFQPEVLTAVDEGLSIARDLMQEILPLASQGFFAINGALEQVKAAIDSIGFRQFLADMTQMVVPATNAIMKLAMTILGVLGNALEQLAPLSIPFIGLVTAIIQALGGPATAALKVVIGLIVGLGQAIEPLLPGLSAIATELINDIGSSFQSFIPIITQVVSILGGSLLKILQDLMPVIANALTPNSPFMLALGQLPALLNAIMPLITGFASILANPMIAQAAVWVVSLVVAFQGLMGVAGLIGGAFAFLVGLPAAILGSAAAMTIASAASKAWAAAQWLLDAALDANPVALIIIGIAALIAVIVVVVTHLHAFSAAFDDVRHTMASWGHDVASVFDRIRHDIAAAVDGVINFLKAHWKLILSILLDPIGTAVMEIKDHTHQIAQAFDTMRHDVAAIIDGARHDISTAFDNVRHDIAVFADWVPHEIAHLWDEARHYEAEALDNIRHDIASAWDNVRHETAVLVDDVLAFFARLPGQVLSFLASLPGKMLSAGENVIKGLINGILNAAAQIPSIMAGLASDVASYFTDPLKLFSPSRLFFEHGYNIVQGAINGVKANAPNLLATMRGLGTGVGAAGTGSSLAAGAIAPATGSSSMHVTVPVTIQGSAAGAQSPQYMQGLQTAVQEAVLRYGQLNPGNGLTTAWGH